MGYRVYNTQYEICKMRYEVYMYGIWDMRCEIQNMRCRHVG